MPVPNLEILKYDPKTKSLKSSNVFDVRFEVLLENAIEDGKKVTKVPENSFCPCGSRKKFRNCCGKKTRKEFLPAKKVKGLKKSS
jgi:hypothetical protein